MEPFATVGDLESRWKQLNDAETAWAEGLLASASRQVRARVLGVDDRVAAGTLDPETVKDVVCEMVREVMLVTTPGAIQQSTTVGSVTKSTSFREAAGRLRLTRYQRETLMPLTRRGRAGSVSSLPASAGTLRAPGAEHWGNH